MSPFQRISIFLYLVLLAPAMNVRALKRPATPPPLRLLPNSPGVIYFDLRPLRAEGLFRTPVAPAPSYARFLRETGFNWEHDLDQVAMALWPLPNDTRALMVMTGRFSPRMHAWIEKQAQRRWTIHGRQFFRIEGLHRPLVLSWLSRGELALSNQPAPSSLQPLLQRWEGAHATPLPRLLRDLNWSRRRRDFLLAAMQPSAWPTSVHQARPELNLFQGARRLRLSAQAGAAGPRLSLQVDAANLEQARNLAAELITLRLMLLNAAPSRANGAQEAAPAAAPNPKLTGLAAGLGKLVSHSSVHRVRNRVWLRLQVPINELRAWFNAQQVHLAPKLAPQQQPRP